MNKYHDLGSGDRFGESKGAMEASDLRVSRKHIEALWTSVGQDTSDPHAGIFGPSSISWKVNRESALFLGAGRAALLQAGTHRTVNALWSAVSEDDAGEHNAQMDVVLALWKNGLIVTH